jgi:hypothetical protein
MSLIVDWCILIYLKKMFLLLFI